MNHHTSTAPHSQHSTRTARAETHQRHERSPGHAQQSHYMRLLIMGALSFVAMYLLMYAMVDVFGHVRHNLNQAYMAGLMAAPMVVIELLVMGIMYHNKKLNALLLGGCVVAGVLFFAGIRNQTSIDDGEFLRSMIPHHGGAILMCREASIQDPEIKALCDQIAESQTREIAQMETILARLDR